MIDDMIDEGNFMDVLKGEWSEVHNSIVRPIGNGWLFLFRTEITGPSATWELETWRSPAGMIFVFKQGEPTRVWKVAKPGT